MPFKDANLSIASSPVLYGLSVYTVFNAIWNKNSKELNIFRLKDHYKRLCNSARIMDFESFEDKYSYAESATQKQRAGRCSGEGYDIY